MKLPQDSSVWEGDRSTLHDGLQLVQGDMPEVEDYVLWVDGTQGIVRTIETISPDAGPEAIVRALLKAIEYPHQPGYPARPKKIVVRDRQIQLYLKSILQDLEITLEFVPELPLIDDLLEDFKSFRNHRPSDDALKYEGLLLEKAEQLWNTAPWALMGDHQILEVEINQWDLGTVYVSVLGNLGMEFGILSYRNLDSLKEFRVRAVAQGSMAEMEAAFLAQDCIFMNYETDDRSGESPRMRPPIPYESVEPSFGSLHPLEGMRSFLHEDETIALAVILEALHRFVTKNRAKLIDGQFPAITSRYKLPIPDIDDIPNPLTVKVSTRPDLAAEFLDDEEDEYDEDDYDEDEKLFRDDLVPGNAFVGFGKATLAFLAQVKPKTLHYQELDKPAKSSKKPSSEIVIPTFLLQTSMAKAKAMIKMIQAMDGVQGLGFHSGEDEMTGNRQSLGLLKTKNNEVFLLGEFDQTDPEEREWLDLWQKRLAVSKGHCALIIAKGNTGSSKGSPNDEDILAVFETKVILEEEFSFGEITRSIVFDG